jgi:hypothetical protein
MVNAIESKLIGSNNWESEFFVLIGWEIP